MDKFDIGAFGNERDILIAMAKCAEAAERYDDMCAFMKKLVDGVSSSSQSLTIEERNLLSVAYKNVIGARRGSWRTLKNDIAESDTVDENMVKYKEEIEKEIDAICNDILDLLKSKLIEADPSKEGDKEEKVFFLKMAGDYYRYLAESIAKTEHKENTKKYYGQAWDLASSGDTMAPTHPIRLGLALNYSVCHYEILKDKESACQLAKFAFDAAISELDQLKEEDYRDSTLIMQLLRDNLTLWTNSEAEAEDVLVEDLDAGGDN